MESTTSFASSFESLSTSHYSSPGRSKEVMSSRHFLDSCFLCKKHLAAGDDIYMYRGDTPFCSEECRQDQMEIDDADERSMKSIKEEKEKKKKRKQRGRTSAFSSFDGNLINVNATASAVAYS